MAEKLKSALKIIHWSLAFKAILAGLSWIYFPWWLSVFVLLGIYFVPLFQTRHLFVPFSIAVVLGWILPANSFAGLMIALEMYILLGIKDFIFINRKGAFQILAALFLAEAGVVIYSVPDNWLIGSFMYSLLFGLVYYFSGKKLFDLSSESSKNGGKSVIAVFSFLLVQISFALNFLPISSLYKSLLLILASVIFFEWQNFLFSGDLTKNKIISYAMFFVGLTVLIFAGVSWGL
jgi:hypothetical protein